MLPHALAEIVVAAAHGRGQVGAAGACWNRAERGGAGDCGVAPFGERKAVLLGNGAEQHADASQLLALAQALAELTGAKLGCLMEAANSVGGMWPARCRNRAA